MIIYEFKITLLHGIGNYGSGGSYGSKPLDRFLKEGMNTALVYEAPPQYM